MPNFLTKNWFFLKVFIHFTFWGAQESIPPVYVAIGGPERQLYFYSVPITHRLFYNSSTVLEF